MFELTVRGKVEKVALRDIPVLRQAFVVAGFLILSGLVLGLLLHPGFLALPLLVSGGLIFSGLAGWCPMAVILSMLPWNR